MRYHNGLARDPKTGKTHARRWVDGPLYHRCFRLRADAEEYLRNFDRADAGLEARPGTVTLADAWAAYVRQLNQRGQKKGTTPDALAETLRFYATKYRAIEREFGAVAALAEVRDEDLDEYVERRRSGRRPVGNRTIRAELLLLRRLTKRAGVTPRWQMPELVVRQRPRRAPSPEEVAKPWRELEGPARTALGLFLLTGTRASEALRLDVANVDRKAKTIRLAARKTSDELRVALVPTLERLLPKSGRAVAASAAAVRSALVRASVRADLPRWSGPGLGRHAFATWAVQLGGFRVADVVDALGHRLPGVATPLYIHAQAVEPMRRPMSRFAERTLLRALRDLDRGCEPRSNPSQKGMKRPRDVNR